MYAYIHTPGSETCSDACVSDGMFKKCIPIYLSYLMECFKYILNILVVCDGTHSINLGGLQADLKGGGAPTVNKLKSKDSPQALR